MDNLRFDGYQENGSNSRIRQLCGVTKGVDKKIDGVLRWVGLVERMENDRIAKRVFVRLCWESLSG